MVQGGNITMKITKYAHACFVVEHDNESLVVDPGDWSNDFVIPNNVVAVMITHEHGDHLDKGNLQQIVDKNPSVMIIAHEGIVPLLEGFNTRAVVPNEGTKIGTFELEFFGGQHALITPDWQPVPNLGVLINEHLYYPGDSFTIPEGNDVEVLALPAAAPWMKISEAIAFLQAVKPKLAFPTHDAILSDVGKKSADKWLGSAAKEIGAEYRRLHEPIEI